MQIVTADRGVHPEDAASRCYNRPRPPGRHRIREVGMRKTRLFAFAAAALAAALLTGGPNVLRERSVGCERLFNG